MKIFHLVFLLLAVLVGSQLFGLHAVEAVPHCCVYYGENQTGVASCLNINDNTQFKNPDGSDYVIDLDNPNAECPAGTYREGLLGGYKIDPEPIAESYKTSSISSACLDLGVYEESGVTLEYKVKTISTADPVCAKAITGGGVDIKQKIVATQHAQIKKTLADASGSCCVPLSSKVDTPNACKVLSLLDSVIDTKFVLNPTQFIFPTDNELRSFYRCDPAATDVDWVKFSPSFVSATAASVKTAAGGVQYVVYPESCGASVNTYIPPWDWNAGGNIGIPHQLSGMCLLVSNDKYCACDQTGNTCKSAYYSTKEKCEDALPVTINDTQTQATRCVALDESKGTSASCSSAVGKILEETTPFASTLPTSAELSSKLNPLGTFTPQQLLGRIIKSALGILGSIALVIFLYGGITWMTSMGSSDKIQKSLSTLVWGALGVIVILASYSIVSFVLENIPK